jgi:hypothetical protein
MIDPKPINKLNASDRTRSDLTPRTFTRAAGLANLIVAPMVFVELSVMSLVLHDARTFRVGLWLVPFVTLVIWVSAAVLYVLAVARRGLRAPGRRPDGRSRTPLLAGSGVWDDWLDSPEPRDRRP